MLDRRQPLLLHGDGTNKRSYLYASDAADAFDTILHCGVPGEVYNVESIDEVRNVDVAHRLLDFFNIPQSDAQQWIKHTVDRPFNDHRYYVDATKLKALGWQQKVRFEEGLTTTVDWYRRWGRSWWKGTDALFDSGLAFPEVGGEGIVGMGTVRTPLLEVQQEKLFAANANAGVGEMSHADGKENNGTKDAQAAGLNGAGFLSVPTMANSALDAKRNTRKRARESDGEGKENLDLAAKRQMLGEDFIGGGDVVR